MTQDAHGRLRDVHGLVANAFEVAIDARNSEEKAQVSGHGLLQCEQALDALVNFDLHFVDRVFLREHGFREVFFGVQDGMDCLMDRALGEASHPQQPLLQFFEIAVEMSFHGSSVSTATATTTKSVLQWLKPLRICHVRVVAEATTYQASPCAESFARKRMASHPKRPVMYASVRGSFGVVNSLDVSLCSISFPSSMNAV